MKKLVAYLRRLPPGDRLWEFCAAGMAAGLVLFCAVAYPFLPGRIPVHMDVAGRPDGYGPKIVLWGIVGCAIGLYAFLTYLGSWSR